jgi:hypothetical protein
VHNTEKTWKFDLKNDVALYLGHPKGTVYGGTVYYPFINKIAERADLTPANISEDVFKRYFSTRYEIRELSTSKKLSELFANLENEVGVEDAIRFSVRLMDEDEVPSEEEKVVSQNTSLIPTKAVEMMKHQPQELCNNFERLWNNQHKRNVKIPATTDRVTCSMTTRGNVKALIAKSTRLKVKDV